MHISPGLKSTFSSTSTRSEASKTVRCSGLMWLTSAISLSEFTLARFAALFFHNPEEIVVVNGGTWSRQEAVAFYKSCLKNPFKSDGNGFGSLQSLRDLYAHGYGVPAVAEKRDALARKLHQQFHAILTTPASAEELALGYQDTRYLFGEGTTYDRRKNELKTGWLSNATADLSPLVTYRILLHVKQHIANAYSALLGDIRDDMTLENCKFWQLVENRKTP